MPPSQTQSQSPEQLVRVTQILVGALLMGVLTFAVVATVLQTAGSVTPAQGQPANPDTLLMVLGLLMVPAVGIYFLFGAVAKAQAKRLWEQRADDEQGRAALAQTLQITTILRAALAEGFGLFACVLILIQGSMIAWGAVGLCLVLLVALLPTKSRFRALEEAATGVRSVEYGPRVD